MTDKAEQYVRVRDEPGRVYPVVLEITKPGREWPNTEREVLLTAAEAKRLVRELTAALRRADRG